jgi:hypothetical protein
MSKWLVLQSDELRFENVQGAEMMAGAMRYLLVRQEDGSFGSIRVGDREILPSGPMVYVQSVGTVHIQVG